MSTDQALSIPLNSPDEQLESALKVLTEEGLISPIERIRKLSAGKREQIKAKLNIDTKPQCTVKQLLGALGVHSRVTAS